MTAKLKIPRIEVVAEFPDAIHGWPLIIERAANARMKLALGSGEVLFVWPERTSLARAQAFFNEHRAWLDRTVRSHRRVFDRAEADLKLDPHWPGRLPWFGKLLPVHFSDGPARLTVHSDHLDCRVPLHRSQPVRAVQRLLIASLTDALTARSRQWLADFEPRVGRRCQDLRIRPMKSLWGSLSPQGAVTLNLALAFPDEHIAEYVLAHEMAHFIEHGHGPRFWTAVSALYPDYEEARRVLAREHRYLQALLVRLTRPWVGS